MKSFPAVEVALGLAVAVVAYLAATGVNVLPVLFMGGLVLLMLQTNGLRNMGNTKVKAATTATVPGVKFEDIGGQAAAKKELLEAIEFISNREQIEKMGIRPLKGILLTGPPGTGKTLLAKAAAHHTGSVFLAASGSEFVEMYAGVGAQRVRELFRKAREVARREKKASAVIFIDAHVCYTLTGQPNQGRYPSVWWNKDRSKQGGHLCTVVDRRPGERHHA